MAAGGLKIDVRRGKILEILHREGQVRVARLAQVLNATPVTIRSDLNALASEGYLERVQGGAVQTVNGYYDLEFQQRKQEHGNVKKHIAALAAEQIRDGNTIFINSGTTTYYVAVELKRHKNLQIVTNSLAIARELGDQPTFRVILLGGEINAQYAFTYGSDAQEQLKKYRADHAILGMDGVCPRRGLTTYHPEEAVMNRLMMERANDTILVAHGQKIGSEGFSFVSDTSGVGCLVTDPTANREVLRQLREQNIRIIYR